MPDYLERLATAPDECGACGVTGHVNHGTPHLPSCPQVTDVWPVRQADLDAGVAQCPACGAPFAVGDRYTRRSLDAFQDFRTIPTVVLVCLGCAVLDREPS